MSDEMRRARRFDPDRRARIVTACLGVIAEHGVAGTTHRRVATAADVSLGSMTYHFAGMDELLRAAFEEFAEGIAARFERQLMDARTAAEVCEAIVEIVTGEVYATRQDLVLTHELYTLAARDPRFREVTNGWMRRSRTALGRHFDPVTTVMLDALIEGLSIHSALDAAPIEPSVVLAAVRRITEGSAP